MFSMDLRKYKILNELAEKNGIVIFGGNEDVDVPLGELKQAFHIESRMYNRSIANLSIDDAISAYDACVAPLAPETVLLHIGKADLARFTEDAAAFDEKYRALIAHIRSLDANCRIAIVSLKNFDADPAIAQLNTHLKYIADSERCEFGNISDRHVWNLKGTMEAISFVNSMPFLRSLSNRQPIYDLVRIVFCYGA